MTLVQLRDAMLPGAPGQMTYITLPRRRSVASSSSRTRSARVDREKTAAAAADASSTSRETAEVGTSRAKACAQHVA